MKRRSGQTGMSLVEATIILLTLMMLTAVLAPSIWDYVNDARDVKVKEDCEAIGVSIARLMRDVPCISMVPNAPDGGCNVADRADLLTSDAQPALGLSGPAAVPFSTSAQFLKGGSINWDSALPTNNVDSLENHLVKGRTAVGGAYLYNYNHFLMPIPKFGYGWRGEYISSPVNGDPWGHKYYVNTVFLAAYGFKNGACAVTDEGCYGWTYDTICLSPGRNGYIETPFADVRPALGSGPYGYAAGTLRGGDDFEYSIAGASR